MASTDPGVGKITGTTHVLVVDDDKDVLITAELILKGRFQFVTCISNPHDLPGALETHRPDVVLLDMNYSRGATSGAEGIYWLKQIKQINPDCQVVMATAYGEIDLAVQAVKDGAADFIVKPWENEKLIATLQTCARLGASHRTVKQLQSRHQALSAELNNSHDELIGDSPSFRTVLNLVDKISASDANVLILGENGTGKELVARAIHRGSPRAPNPMITVDAGAVPASLFEAEMFGHARGAFTDAREDRVGKFEMASGGTLFLDEIGNLELSMQAKLLRALESRSVSRVGSSESVSVDIRLICATNLTSEELDNQQRFRRDLLYRVNTVEIAVPPLRQRPEDIPLLLEHFINVYSVKYRKGGIGISASALSRLVEYSWPGNIRELKHAVERAILIAESSQLTLENFLVRPTSGEPAGDDLNLIDLERSAIIKAIRKHDGNLTRVAKALGLGRTTLYRKMEKYGLSDQAS
ncbi:MAG: sigma-54 dependent transcriptional regulator [Pseudohongiellaceae bacterium]